MEVANNTILIVEDNVGFNELIGDIITESGFNTFSVYSAGDAFEWLKVNTALLMLLDFSLPDMNAKEFIESLISESIQLPQFIVATGQGDERIAVQMMKLGARDYITKDGNFLEMISLVVPKAVAEIQNEQRLKTIEIELAASNLFNNQIIKGVHQGIVVYDLDLNYLVWNPFMEKITGVQSKDVLGKNVLDVFPFFENTEMSEKLTKAINGEQQYEHEFYYSIPQTAKTAWVSESIVALRNAEDQIIGAIATIHDITERKKSVQALHASEELYRNLVERLPDGVYKSTSDGKFVEINQAIVKMLGYSSKEELMAVDIRTGLYFDEIDRDCLIQNELNQITDAYLLRKKDGTGVWVEDHGWYKTDEQGNIIAHEGVLRDITERKKNEDALRESERRFSDMALNSAGVIYQFYARNDGTMGFYYLSHKTKELFGINYDINTSKWDVGDFIHPDDKEAFSKAVLESIAQVKEFNIEARVVTPLGDKWVHFLSSPTLMKDEVVFNGIMIDITQRISTEQFLKETEAKYRELVENSPDAITIYIDGNIVFVNKACVDLIGATSADTIIGRSVFDFVHPDSRSIVTERMNTMQTSGIVLDLQEEKFIRLDNTPIDVEVKAMSLILQNKLAVQLIVRDITERKKIQNEIVERRDLLRQLLTTSMELIDSSSELLNYQKITDITKHISGGKYVCFNIFDEDGLSFKTVAISGLSDFQQKELDLFGFMIIDKKWDFDPVRESLIKDAAITEFDSLAKLTGLVIPKFIVNIIQKTHKLGKIAIVKISKKNKIIGDFTILMEKDTSVKNSDILELFSNQVALFIDRQISEDKLRKNEEKFRVLFSDNPQPMFVYNVDTLEILEINQTALDFYGYTKDESFSMTVKQLYPLDEIPNFLETMKKTKQNINTDGTSRHIKKNGQKVNVEIFSVPASYMGHNARHVLVVDITERMLSEEKLSQKMDELMRFQHLTVGREHTMIELKKEINSLLTEFGKKEKYKIVE